MGRRTKGRQGRQEDASDEKRLSYEPDCYLCPGNERANGEVNPNYDKTLVFTNDFPALMPDTAAHKEAENKFFRRHSVTGTSRVVCFSPRHDLTLAEMSVEEIRAVIEIWVAQTQELGDKYRWVQIFENKGELMGCSNPHPHCQIWACNEMPDVPTRESKQQSIYFDSNKRVFLLDYLEAERERKLHSHILWDGMVDQLVTNTSLTGNFTLISIRPCFVRR